MTLPRITPVHASRFRVPVHHILLFRPIWNAFHIGQKNNFFFYFPYCIGYGTRSISNTIKRSFCSLYIFNYIPFDIYVNVFSIIKLILCKYTSFIGSYLCKLHHTIVVFPFLSCTPKTTCLFL